MKIKITNIAVEVLNANQPDRPDFLEAKITATYQMTLPDGHILSGGRELQKHLLLQPMMDEIAKSIINGVKEEL